MRIQAKKLVGTKWAALDLGEVQGSSLLTFILKSTETVVAAMFEEDKAVAFISNDDKYVEEYREKGLSLHAKDLALLVGADPLPDIVLSEIPGIKLYEVGTV